MCVSSVKKENDKFRITGKVTSQSKFSIDLVMEYGSPNKFGGIKRTVLIGKACSS